MTRAISLFCCCVVGLEVLVGIPLIVCAGFLMMAEFPQQEFQVATGPVAWTPPAYPPPPSMNLPPPLTPAETLLPCQPATAGVPVPAIPAELEAIVSAREAQAGPWSESSLQDASRTEPFVAALVQVAAQEAQIEAAAAPESKPELPPDPPVETPAVATPVVSPPATDPAPSMDPQSTIALESAVQVLYKLAETYEQSDFARADEVRALARRIRQEISTLNTERAHSLPPATMPAPSAPAEPPSPCG